MKPFLRWRSDWLLDVEALDSQHIAIAVQLSRIHTALMDGYVSSHLDPQRHHLLLELADLTQHHFQCEEALMEAHDYPAKADHHREHLMLLAELHALIREIKAGRKRFTLEVLTSLKHWQIDHVLCSDKEFAAFLHRREAIADNHANRLWTGTKGPRDRAGLIG